MHRLNLVLLLILLLVACGGEPANTAAWLAVPLTDVTSGESFTLAEFAGQTVIVEAMAVWCPLCTTQQQMIAAAKSELGDEVVVVSLDVDPNENADVLKQHAALMGWDWRFAIAPPEMIQMLQAAFGPGIMAVTSTPVVLVGPDGVAQETPAGIKGWELLISLVEELDS